MEKAAPRGIESMAGGTTRSSPQLIQNECFTVAFLRRNSSNIAMPRHCQGDFLLDIPSALIEGRPHSGEGQKQPGPRMGYPPASEPVRDVGDAHQSCPDQNARDTQ